MDSFSESLSDDSTRGDKLSASQKPLDKHKAIAPTKKKKKRFPGKILLVLILIIAGTKIYSSFRRQDASPSLESLTVPTKTQALDITIEASGSIEPVDSVNISPKTTGRLIGLYVEQGDEVEAGQLLAEMDSANLQAEFAQAQAELAQAEAEYARVLNGNRSEAVARARSQVRSARARADLAAKRLEKYRFLAREGAIAQLTLDEYLSEAQTAQASLVEAKEQLQELETGSRSEDIEQAKAKVRAAEAKVALAQTRLDDTNIRAPFDGIVSQKYAVVGSIVTPDVSASTTSSATSSSILSIASDLEVNVNVSEASIVHIKPDQTVEIIADAYPNQTFKGRVQQIAPEAVVENNVTSFEVKVELITGQQQLRSGMNVDAVFIGQTIDNALIVPTVAVTSQRGEIGVMVARENGAAEFQPVTIGLSQDGQTQIIRGLEQGDRVFIDAPPEQSN